MEEKKKIKAGNVAVGICLFVIAILLVLIVLFFYNSNKEKNETSLLLHNVNIENKHLKEKNAELNQTIKEKEEKVIELENNLQQYENSGETNLDNEEESSEESKKDESENEFSNLIKYIEKIYPKPGFNGGIPKFDNISNADKEWIWSVAIKNECTEYDFASEEDIRKSANELFGEGIGEFPGEKGNLNIVKYGENYYWAGDQRSIPEVFKYQMTSISSTTANNNTYIIGIVEYMVNDWADGVWIGNLKGEKIKTFTTSYEEECDYNEVEEYVMKNLEKFDSKTLTIQYNENENQYRIISVK